MAKYTFTITPDYEEEYDLALSGILAHTPNQISTIELTDPVMAMSATPTMSLAIPTATITTTDPVMTATGGTAILQGDTQEEEIANYDYVALYPAQVAGYSASGTMHLGYQNSQYRYNYMLFEAYTIPTSSTIISAELVLTLEDYDTGYDSGIAIGIGGDMSPVNVGYPTSYNDLLYRNRTSNYGLINNALLASISDPDDELRIDVTDVIQEIVSAPTWTSGWNIGLGTNPDNSQLLDFNFYNYTGTYPPYLTITYT